MPKPTLYITRPLPDPVMVELSDRFTLTCSPSTESPTRKTILKGIRDAEALIPTLADQIDAELMADARRLRVIANYAVGYNNIDVPAAQARGIVVTNTPDILTDSTADLTWALILATARRILAGHELIRQKAWAGWEPRQLLGTDVYGRTLGIIGMGRIGQAVARRARGFDMPIIYYTRGERNFSDQPSWKSVGLDAVLTRADFLSLHVPLTESTRHLIGPRELRLMRPTAYLINVSRGPVVNETALVEALQEGRLAGAGLDVYEHEPTLHPGLFTLANVVTLPHLGSATHTTRTRMGMVCLENALAVMEGRIPPNRVA